MLFEDSSEIASARVSSIYRKSSKDSIFRSRQPTLHRKLSLSKISEEESENHVNSERDEDKQLENIMKEGNDNFVSDKDIMSDKVTSETTNGSTNNGHDDIAHDDSDVKRDTIGDSGDTDSDTPISSLKEVCESKVIFRFIPEMLENNKITIV